VLTTSNTSDACKRPYNLTVRVHAHMAHSVYRKAQPIVKAEASLVRGVRSSGLCSDCLAQRCERSVLPTAIHFKQHYYNCECILISTTLKNQLLPRLRPSNKLILPDCSSLASAFTLLLNSSPLSPVAPLPDTCATDSIWCTPQYVVA
jgi:hypothetical protein